MEDNHDFGIINTILYSVCCILSSHSFRNMFFTYEVCSTSKFCTIRIIYIHIHVLCDCIEARTDISWQRLSSFYYNIKLFIVEVSLTQ